MDDEEDYGLRISNTDWVDRVVSFFGLAIVYGSIYLFFLWWKSSQ
jgi:hypothetical protein